MRIRKATSLDKGDIRRIYLSAFPENERDLVADVAIQLLVEEEAEPRHGAFSLVAEEADDENNDVKTIVGHVAFSEVRNERDKKNCGFYIGASRRASRSPKARHRVQSGRSGNKRADRLGSTIAARVR